MRELDILSKLIGNLSDEEVDELLDMVDKKNKKEKKNKSSTDNKFLSMDIEEDEKIREASKKLNQGKKKIDEHKRPKVRIVRVNCKNCNKPYDLPENYPNLENFCCCIR